MPERESLVGVLQSAAAAFSQEATSEEARRIRTRCAALLEAADAVARSWSGSSLGYHANVYYKDLAPPPPQARFDAGWGLMQMLSNGTRGEWVEQNPDDVVGQVFLLAGEAFDSTLDADEAVADAVRDRLDDVKSSVLSSIAVQLQTKTDTFLEALRDEIREVSPFTRATGEGAQLPSGRIATHDSAAASQGLRLAPHQSLVARVAAIDSVFESLKKLAKLVTRAADHVQREAAVGSVRTEQAGSKVFIGHGRSQDWRELRDFIERRLSIPVDEFNQVPIAGITNVDRLKSMLDDAAMAFLILTAEDESASGVKTARQNVVHEVGLFQGRLGFSRAVVVLEEGCEELSNIHGLGQLRFPSGRISSIFEQVRELLEREGIVET